MKAAARLVRRVFRGEIEACKLVASDREGRRAAKERSEKPSPQAEHNLDSPPPPNRKANENLAKFHGVVTLIRQWN
jgi:hypothetical protein